MSTFETKFDVIILGAGPAGLSSALWCSELGLKSIILERHTEPGGQLNLIHVPIQNYLGIDTIDGQSLLREFLASFRGRRFEIKTGVQIDQIDLREKNVILSGDENLVAGALIIATGVRRRKLGVEGEDRYIGRGILETGQIAREKLAGKTLMIVGG